MKNMLLLLCSSLIPLFSSAQGNPPWERPLKMAWSTDGTTFTNESIFQDSAGVPSLVRWKGDTLACVFQWFRQPMGSATWDKVAIKFSYDLGQTWTEPQPVNFPMLPPQFQRPFDPTLAVVSEEQLRVYYSSSNGMPVGGLDATVNTYSAISSDGINFTFESLPRFDHPTDPVIDPAILFFNGEWHYSAPNGAPQNGAFHCTSADGLTLTQHSNWPSDNQHNWTGNLMLESETEMRFYGSGQYIWHNRTNDGFNWLGYTNTNVLGGDPSVWKLGPNSYIMIYVGEPYVVGLDEKGKEAFTSYPNPFTDRIHLSKQFDLITLSDHLGRMVWQGGDIAEQDFSFLPFGIYMLTAFDGYQKFTTRIQKL